MSEEKFSYTYSAQRHAEIEQIRRKYEPSRPPDDKLEYLRQLDKSCERAGTVVSILAGVMGTLVFGGGMAMIFKMHNFGIGIPVGLAGLCIMAAAVPVFRKMTAVRRKRLAPEILRLIEELENPPSA